MLFHFLSLIGKKTSIKRRLLHFSNEVTNNKKTKNVQEDTESKKT